MPHTKKCVCVCVCVCVVVLCVCVCVCVCCVCVCVCVWCVCVCVWCVCVCVELVYMVYEDTNLYNNMGIQHEDGLWGLLWNIEGAGSIAALFIWMVEQNRVNHQQWKQRRQGRDVVR